MKITTMALLTLVALPMPALAKGEPITVSVPATTVTMRPDRKDLTVGTWQVLVTCQRRRGNESVNCLDFKVNGNEIAYAPATGRGPATFQQDYTAGSGPGKFSMPALSIEFSAADDAYVCIAYGATLNEIPKQFDSYYFTGRDRYAVLTWCSVEQIPAWGWDNARVTNNRAATIGELRQRLAAPIDLRMSSQPLPGKIANGRLGPGVYIVLDLPVAPDGAGTIPRGQELRCPE